MGIYAVHTQRAERKLQRDLFSLAAEEGPVSMCTLQHSFRPTPVSRIKATLSAHRKDGLDVGDLGLIAGGVGGLLDEYQVPWWLEPDRCHVSCPNARPVRGDGTNRGRKVVAAPDHAADVAIRAGDPEQKQEGAALQAATYRIRVW